MLGSVSIVVVILSVDLLVESVPCVVVAVVVVLVVEYVRFASVLVLRTLWYGPGPFLNSDVVER